jgi:hypothetical protein
MKNLLSYVQDAHTKLFNDTGAFFAFSNEQYAESAKDGVQYISLGSGLLCPQENVKRLNDGLILIQAEGISKDLAENGKRAIIKRELHNYEAFYICDIEDTVDALSRYGITREEVKAVYDAVAPTIEY